MKRIIVSIMILMLLMTTVVLADNQEHPEQTRTGTNYSDVHDIENISDNAITERERERFREQLDYEFHPSVNGLENAIARVRNESEAEHLTQVMDRIQERYVLRLQNLSNVTFEEMQVGNYEVSGLGRARFLGLLNLGYNYKYSINETTGDLQRIPKPFDFLFTNLDS